MWLDEPTFDPLIHLEVGRPISHCYTFPEEAKVSETDFKFTEPFQILSPEGLRVALELVERNRSYARAARQHEAIRGMGYRSRFIKDLNHCSLLTYLFGDLMGGMRLQPHPIVENYS